MSAILYEVVVPRPWSLVMAVIAVIGAVAYAWAFSRIWRTVERNLAASVHPVFQPGLYTGLGWITSITSLVSCLRGLGMWYKLHESAQMAIVVDGIMGSVMLGTVIIAWLQSRNTSD